MSDEYEKINVQEYLPILDKIKEGISTLLQLKVKELNTDVQIIKDPPNPEISRPYERQLSDEDYNGIFEKLKAKRNEVRLKEAQIFNLEANNEDLTDECNKLGKAKMKLTAELAKIKEEHSGCETKFVEYSKKIEILTKQSKDRGSSSKDTTDATDEKSIDQFEEPHFPSSIETDSIRTSTSRHLSHGDSIDARDFASEIESKNIEIEELKQRCMELQQIVDNLTKDKYYIETGEFPLEEHQKRKSSDKILTDDEIRGSGSQPQPVPKRDSTGGGGIFSALFSPKTKPTKSELDWSLVEPPYPEWWTKHMVY